VFGQVPDDEQSPAAWALQEVGIPGIRHSGGVEPGSLVLNAQPYVIDVQFRLDMHQFQPIGPVPELDGVGESLGEGNAKPEEGMLARIDSGETVVGEQLDRGVDQGDIARQPQGEGQLDPVTGAAWEPLEGKRARITHRPASESLKSFLDTGVDREQGIELGELEEGAEVVVETGEPDLSPCFAHPLGDGDERPESRRIDVPGR